MATQTVAPSARPAGRNASLADWGWYSLSGLAAGRKRIVKSRMSPFTLRLGRLSLQRLENRITPAAADWTNGVLTINYTASGTTTEAVMLANDGANIVLSGDVTGSLTNPTSAVTQVVVMAGGSSTAQSLTVTGST